MKNLSLMVAATCMCWGATAQWAGPSGGVLKTTNKVSVEQNGYPVLTGYGPLPAPLFETKIVGLPTTGALSAPGGIKFPLYVSFMGSVGIGTSNPSSSLTVRGNILAENAFDSSGYLDINSQGQIVLTTDGKAVGRGLRIKSKTNDIFVVTPDMLLFRDKKSELMKVDSTGQLFARRMVVTVSNPFPDYVFSSTYELMPLNKLAAFIEANKHLPHIPSAGEITANNKQMELGEMQVLLLEKVEELTLYILQQQKQIEELQQLLNETSE